jgi:MFS family permease
VKARLAFLKLRDLRLVFGATLASQLGDGVVGVALAFAVLNLTRTAHNRTGSATDLGIVIAVRTVAQVSALLVGGVVADRVNRRVVMIGSDLTRLVGQAALGALLVSGNATLPEVIASQIALGAAGGFFNPASAGLIPSVAGEYLQEANAMQGIAQAGSGILGTAIGGVLVVAVGPGAALLVDAGSYLVSASLLSRVRLTPAAVVASAEEGEEEAAEAKSFFSDLRGGFDEVRSRNWVWSLIISLGIANAMMGCFEVLGPVICREHYGGAPAFALFGVCFGTGSVLGGTMLLGVKPRFPLRLAVILVVPCLFPSFLLAAQAPIWAIVPFTLLAGAGPIGFNTLWWTTLQQHVPKDAISRVISFDFAGSFALQPLGYLLAGPVAVAVGVPAAFLIFGAAGLVPLLSNFLIKDVRELEALPTPEPDLGAAGA